MDIMLLSLEQEILTDLDDLDLAIKDQSTLERVADTLNDKQELDSVAAEMFSVCTKSLYKRLGIKEHHKAYISLESVSGSDYKLVYAKESVNIALEGIGKAIMDLLRAIGRKIIELIHWIQSQFNDKKENKEQEDLKKETQEAKEALETKEKFERHVNDNPDPNTGTVALVVLNDKLRELSKKMTIKEKSGWRKIDENFLFELVLEPVYLVNQINKEYMDNDGKLFKQFSKIISELFNHIKSENFSLSESDKEFMTNFIEEKIQHYDYVNNTPISRLGSRILEDLDFIDSKVEKIKSKSYHLIANSKNEVNLFLKVSGYEVTLEFVKKEPPEEFAEIKKEYIDKKIRLKLVDQLTNISTIKKTIINNLEHAKKGLSILEKDFMPLENTLNKNNEDMKLISDYVKKCMVILSKNISINIILSTKLLALVGNHYSTVKVYLSTLNKVGNQLDTEG
jgi:hypothetical protein